jgi:hypothetical protein
VALAVCFKLSAGAFAATAWAGGAVAWLRRGGSRRVVAYAAGMSAMLIAVWLARGVVLSGYPMYPSTVAAMPFDWRVPREVAAEQRDAILVWGRQYYEHVQEVRPEWLKPWLRNLPQHAKFEILIPAAMALVAGIVAVLRSGVRRLAPLIPVIFGIAFWFITAPNPRFAAFLFWLLSAIAVAGAGAALGASRRGRLAVVIFCLAPAALLLQRRAAYFWREEPTLRSVAHSLIPPAGSDHGFHETPRVALMQVTTPCGLAVNVPAAGDQCWDAPLPCAPAPPKWDLCPRRPGALGSGFTSQSRVP